METVITLNTDSRDFGIRKVCAVLAGLAAGVYEIVIRPRKNTRTANQNRYLWGVCYATVLQSGQLEGWRAEDLHEYFLGECYGWETLEGFGKRRMRPVRRSSKMSKMEFSEYVGFIHEQAAGMGIVIPDPDPELVA